MVIHSRNQLLSRARPGVATLELAMIFPFLMLLVATIFFVARAVAARTTTITQVRHDAFARRDQASPGVPLNENDVPLASLVQATATRPVPAGPTFPGTTFQAQAICSTTGRTWGTYGQGQQEVSFASPLPFVPSPEPLALLAPYMAPASELGLFSQLMYPLANPALMAAQAPASLASAAISNSLGQLGSLTGAFNSLPAVQAALTAAEILAPPPLKPQIDMVRQLVSLAGPALNDLVAANNPAHAPSGPSPDLASQLQGIQIDPSLLQTLPAFVP